MIKKDILSTPKHGWCNFHLADEEKEFNAALSYLTDVMYDTLKMCLTYLQTGAAAVMYDREGEGTFLFVISDYDVYILDENLTGGMVHFENLRADDICENILGCYYADTIGWLNFANMNEQSEKEYEKVFVKSSTGFYKTPEGMPNGATVPTIKLMLENSFPLPVKAAGGVRTYEEAVEMIQLGVKRIGTSAAKAIVTGEISNSDY